ncbi:unnamed protein product, partial [Owenia fusiformis]
QKRVVKLGLWFRFYWNDIRLRWTPEHYGNIEEYRFMMKDIWVTDMTLYNSASDKPPSIGSTSYDIPIIVKHTGHVSWLFPMVLKTSCAINITHFPFDIQKCPVQFGSWTYTKVQLEMFLKYPKGDISGFTPNGEWSLLHFTAKKNIRHYACCEDPFTDIVYTIVIKRKPLFYIINLILPCGFLLLVSILGFLMPIQSGSRAPLSIMVLVSMTILQI